MASIRSLISKFVSDVTNKITDVASRVAAKGKPTRTKKPKITAVKQGERASVKGTESFSKPAFTKRIVVPPGGFTPKSARAFPMEKPEGVVFRARTHVKNAGKVLEFEGYFTTAVDDVLKTTKQSDLRELIHEIGTLSAVRVRQDIERGTR